MIAKPPKAKLLPPTHKKHKESIAAVTTTG